MFCLPWVPYDHEQGRKVEGMGRLTPNFENLPFRRAKTAVQPPAVAKQTKVKEKNFAGQTSDNRTPPPPVC